MEILFNLIISLEEHLGRLRFDFFTYAGKVFKRLLSILVVCALTFVAFLYFVELFRSHKVYRTKCLEGFFSLGKLFAEVAGRCSNLIHALFEFHKVA